MSFDNGFSQTFRVLKQKSGLRGKEHVDVKEVYVLQVDRKRFHRSSR